MTIDSHRDRAPRVTLKPRWVPVIVGLMIAAHVGLAVDGLRQQWITQDEFAHLPAGLSYWHTGRFFLYHHNPPLIKMLAALPVLSMRPAMPYGQGFEEVAGARQEWWFGAAFMHANPDRYFAYFLAARMVIVALSTIGAMLVFLWSRELFGDVAGLVSLALWCFSPGILAHAQLVTPDIGATVFSLLSVSCFRRYLKRPSWGRALLAGVTLGLAELTKFTLLVLYPTYILLAVSWWLRRRVPSPDGGPARGGLFLIQCLGLSTIGVLAISTGHGSIWLPVLLIAVLLRWSIAHPRPPLEGATPGKVFLAQFLSINILSLVTINAGYGFEGTFQRLGDFSFRCRALSVPNAVAILPDRVNRFRGTLAADLAVPLPRHYLAGLDSQKYDNDLGLVNYLRGRFRQGGWWYYYLYALGIRLPLGTFLLALLAVGLALLRRGYRAAGLDEACLALPAIAVFVLINSQSGLQDSRYLLPCFSFIYISLGRVALPTSGARRGRLVIVMVLLGWNIVETLRCHPHELSYFNATVGGPAYGHHHLLETADWGQDLLFLKRWLARHPEARPLKLAYAGPTDPRILGLSFSLPPYWNPGDDETYGGDDIYPWRYCGLLCNQCPTAAWTRQSRQRRRREGSILAVGRLSVLRITKADHQGGILHLDLQDFAAEAGGDSAQMAILQGVTGDPRSTIRGRDRRSALGRQEYLPHHPRGPGGRQSGLPGMIRSRLRPA